MGWLKGSTVAERTAKASVVGGTASALGGGKFANGAYTAAFQHLLNYEFENKYSGKVEKDPEAFKAPFGNDTVVGGDSTYDANTNTTTFKYSTLDNPAIHDMSEEFLAFTPVGGARHMSVLYAGTRRAFWSGIPSSVALVEARALGLRTLETTLPARLLAATPLSKQGGFRILRNKS